MNRKQGKKMTSEIELGYIHFNSCITRVYDIITGKGWNVGNEIRINIPYGIINDGDESDAVNIG